MIYGVRQLVFTEDVQIDVKTRAFCGMPVMIDSRVMDITQATTNLFVYGTLMPGFPNFHQIESFTTNAQPGTTAGILVDLGAFPALIPGHGIVRGVLLDVDEAALEITDRIEGCSLGRDRCLYLRKEATVFLASGTETTAWTYYFAHPDSIADHPRLVVNVIDGRPIAAWLRE